MDQRLNEIAKVLGSLIGGLQDKQKSYKEYKTDRWYKRTMFGQDKL